MGFSISSPDLDSLAGRMDKVDPIAAYHRAAGRVGGDFESDLAGAFREAGAEDALLDAIGTYIHADGTAYVGIPGRSRQAATAHDIEYGTPTIPPRAPVRNTTAANAPELERKLTQALDEEFGTELAGA